MLLGLEASKECASGWYFNPVWSVKLERSMHWKTLQISCAKVNDTTGRGGTSFLPYFQVPWGHSSGIIRWFHTCQVCAKCVIYSYNDGSLCYPAQSTVFPFLIMSPFFLAADLLLFFLLSLLRNIPLPKNKTEISFIHNKILPFYLLDFSRSL